MTNNVIKFPSRKIEAEPSIHTESLEFAYELIDELHDRLHDETGDCIFTDDEYTAITIFLAEVISAMYLMGHGLDHPIQEIASELFGDVDIDDEMDYNEFNDKIDEET